MEYRNKARIPSNGLARKLLKRKGRRFTFRYTSLRKKKSLFFHSSFKDKLDESSIIQLLNLERRKHRTPATKEEQLYILNNYLRFPLKTLAKKLNRSDSFVKTQLRKMDLRIPDEIIQQRKEASQFQAGHTPANKGKKLSPEQYQTCSKTFFKKGHVPANTLFDGAIRIRSRINTYGRKETYQFIRISKNNWALLHRHVWELNNGPIPNGFVVAFKDGNSLNCCLTNLKLIPLQENMLRNSFHNYPEDIVKTIIMRSHLNRTINKISEKYED